MKPFIKHIFGDKTKKLEPEHHELRFPGGNINVQRTSNGEYWAHIWVNHPGSANHFIDSDTPMHSKAGQIVDSRMDLDHESYLAHGIPSIDHAENAYHLAVRIQTD